MKIVVLDIDGVLNSIDWMVFLDGKFDHPKNQMDPKAVERLNKITDATGAVILVCSTWRIILKKQSQLERCLKAYGIKAKVIGATPIINDREPDRRGREIQRWFSENEAPEQFVIIDDDSDMGELSEHLIKTDVQHGLQDEHVERIIEILGKK